MSAPRWGPSGPKKPRKAAVAYLAALYFRPPTEEYLKFSPLAGLATRYSPRAFSLLVYLHLRCDFETGVIEPNVLDWASPTEASHDERTIRDALKELRGLLPTPSGEYLAVVVEKHADDEALPQSRFLRFSDECWRVRSQVRAHRGESGSPWAAVRISGSVVRGGPWGSLTDATRLVYVALRMFAPAEVKGVVDKKTKKFTWVGARHRTAAFLAEVTGLCEKTVLEAVERLRRVCLIEVTRRPFRANLYRAAFELHIRFQGHDLWFEFTLDSQLPVADERTFRPRFAAAWFDWLKKRRPVRLRAMLAAA